MSALATAPRRAGRPAGKRKKTAWDAMRRRSVTRHAADLAEVEAPIENEVQPSAAVADPASAHKLEVGERLLPAEISRLELIARALWSTNYDEIFSSEMVENERMCGGASSLLPSTYRARLKGEAADKYDRRRRNQQRDELATRLHANNQRHWSPSLVARSIAYFGRTTKFLRRNETRQRRIASKPTQLKVLRMMMKFRPKPNWKKGCHIKCFGYDQTYQWVGVKKRGRRQAVERVDSTGLPMQISHEVYINSIDVALPDGLGTLSAADLARIKANYGSAYTEPFNLILLPLMPSAVEASLLEFARDVCISIEQACQPWLHTQQSPHAPHTARLNGTHMLIAWCRVFCFVVRTAAGCRHLTAYTSPAEPSNVWTARHSKWRPNSFRRAVCAAFDGYKIVRGLPQDNRSFECILRAKH